MNLTVLGSTGRTGTHVLGEGVRRGHRITAFTRRPDALHDRDSLAAVVSADGRDPDALREAIADADAVIAVLGPASRTGPHQTADVAEVARRVMSELGVRRLVITSAYPLVARTPRLPLAILRRVFSAAYGDAAAMESVITASDLDWTIARLNRLIDAPACGHTRISCDLFTNPAALTRADAAAALLDITEASTLIATAVNIAGPPNDRPPPLAQQPTQPNRVRRKP